MIKRKCIISTIPSDSHTWNLIYLQLLLEELGFEVINLGACVPFEDVSEAIMRHSPQLVAISSINGSAGHEAARMITYLKEKHETLPPVVIGGKLTTHTKERSKVARELVDAGFTAVFVGSSATTSFIDFLNELDGIQDRKSKTAKVARTPGNHKILNLSGLAS